MVRFPCLVLALVAVPALAQTTGLPGIPPKPGAALPGAAPRPVAQAPGVVPKRAPIDGVLVLYGNERCPTNSDGDEIVICERRSAQEQYRVPKELRELQVTPENASWAAKAKATIGTGNGVDTIGSCSVSGAGGQTGCFAQAAAQAKAERRAMNKAAQPDLP